MSNVTDTWSPARFDIQDERDDSFRLGLEHAVWVAAGRISSPVRSRLTPYKQLVAMVEREGKKLAKRTDAQLKERARELRLPLRREGFTPLLTAKAFALIREASGRCLGMRHFPSQIMGGGVIIAGKIAEMQTGEGKTLTATLPAATAALAGVPVHVVSVNDYLTQRDAEEMSPLYKFLGLSVGCVVHEVPNEERREHYSRDIVYCSNKELTFDYLRDRMALKDVPSNIVRQSERLYSDTQRSQKLLQRGLHFAILDEADSVLVDEARTPLIISASKGGEDEIEFFKQAADVAAQLESGTDYKINERQRLLRLTMDGRKRIDEITAEFGGLWVGRVRREEVVQQALTAQHMFHRDEHYVIQDEKIQIVDENTGRVMPDRSWERGLHQLIELKEGCPTTQMRETLSKISYQRFFRRYKRLSGMTGTAKEVRNELWDVYDLSVVRVPTNKRSRRVKMPPQVWPNDNRKWDAVIASIEEMHGKGVPVLVGTRSVAASERVCELLTERNLAHQLLNAKQDKDEANIVAQAGGAGCITVATNMAGRGTDIKLQRGTADNGGLHVILTERFEARRVDRQLEGRCARQGDPGVYLEILSLDDIKKPGPSARVLNSVAKTLLHLRVPIVGTKLGMMSLRLAQKRFERYHHKIRKQMIKHDKQNSDLLSFAGRYE